MFIDAANAIKHILGTSVWVRPEKIVRNEKVRLETRSLFYLLAGEVFTQRDRFFRTDFCTRSLTGWLDQSR